MPSYVTIINKRGEGDSIGQWETLGEAREYIRDYAEITNEPFRYKIIKTDASGRTRVVASGKKGKRKNPPLRTTRIPARSVSISPRGLEIELPPGVKVKGRGVRKVNRSRRKNPVKRVDENLWEVYQRNEYVGQIIKDTRDGKYFYMSPYTNNYGYDGKANTLRRAQNRLGALKRKSRMLDELRGY